MPIDTQYIQDYLKRYRLEYPDDIIPLSLYSKPIQQHYKELCMQILKHNFSGTISTFIPGKQFQSLSVTGSTCELNCEHCHTHYLEHMIDVSSEKKLRKTLDNLVEQNALGCLISGGCDAEGRVPLLRFHQTLKEYKQNTSLIFNFHVGLINEQEIQKIADIQPNFVSFDLTLDEEIIRDVYHLRRQVQDYVTTYQSLIKNGVRTIPHICVGLNFGDIKNELMALQEIAKCPVDLIVFLVIIPPPDHPKFHSANIKEVGNLFTTARLLFPQTELSLGCMRPRDSNRYQIEELAFHSGFNRYEIPSRKTLKMIKENGFTVKTFNVCCAVSNSKLDELSTP
jgi:uncharacterized radical SAM superfamily protein